MASSTAENYLKAILVQSGDRNAPVATGALATALGVTPGTITTMVKSLAAQKLLKHHPRQGVQLTAHGRILALAVLRKHRLVETFLVQTLKMDWAEVHQEAEALEHAISDRVLACIDEFLSHPVADPHGDPIPSPNSPRIEPSDVPTLGTCDLFKPMRVARILDQSPGHLEFIQRAGLKPGARVTVTLRDANTGTVQCEIRSAALTLGLPEAAKIEVRPWK